MKNNISNNTSVYPNPFIYENFKLINSNQTEHRICDQNKNDFQINENYCEKICIKDCNEIYFSTRFDNSLVLYLNESKIYIKFRNSLEYEYTAEHKYSSVDYMSKIGGLFGLWFGITFLDISELMKKFLGKFKYIIFHHFDFILNVIANIRAIRLITLLLNNFRRIITYLEHFNWKKFIQILSLPLIVFQIWKLTDEYLEYPIYVSVEWIPLRDSLNRLSDESIPAITVCYEHIFEKFLFDEELAEYFNKFFEKVNENLIIYYRILNDISTHNNYITKLIYLYKLSIIGFYEEGDNINKNDINFYKILTYYLDVENKTEFIEKQKHLNDKTLNDLNGTQTQFDFFSFITLAIPYYHYSNQVNYYNNSLPYLQLLSPFGKCFTYLSNSNEFPFDSDHLIRIIESRKSDGKYIHMRYLIKKLFIHSSDVLPDLTTDEIQVTEKSYDQLGDFTIYLTRTDFKKLPKPYETNCRYYGNGNRFECLNECYLNGYNQKWNCTPNDNHLLTIVLKNGIIEPNVKFCYKDDNQIKEFNNYLKRICLIQCLESCEQTLFSLKKNFIKQTNFWDQLCHIDINMKEYSFMKIIFSPQILLLDFIISVVNIISLWHGINIWFSLLLLFNFIKNFLIRLFFYITQKFSIHFPFGGRFIKVINFFKIIFKNFN